METNPSTLTTASGRTIAYNEDSKSAGQRGPLLLEDYVLHEKLAHFNRERIAERVVHAKGSGAFGTFTITNDITHLSRARLFSNVGKQTPVLVRFSTVGGEKGSADTERDPRGFAIKFYTEDGNWDLVGNNTPVFFIKDPKKFPDFIHTQKRDPRTNLKSPTMMWDYWSLNPESLHQVLFLMSDRGIPDGYRFMNGYGSHTFSLINQNDERVWVKFHIKSMQGIRTLSSERATELRGLDPDYAQRDLIEAIDGGNYPQWRLHIQTMTEDQASRMEMNPFDLTKVWPHAQFPLVEVGILELNRNPENYFAEIEQAAFAPAHVVDGIGYSPDKMLQGRLLSYPDAHRYRLGTNYEQIPVNRPQCPVHNHQRDGLARVDGNGGSAPNYWPNSHKTLAEDHRMPEPPMALDGLAAWYDRNGEHDHDHYSQPRQFWLAILDDEARTRLVETIATSMRGIEGPYRSTIVERQLAEFAKVDSMLSDRVRHELGL
jgi:catalase